MRKLLISCAAIAWLASAQSVNPDQRARLPREIQDVIDQAPAASPELAADILLRLVEAGKVPNKKLKTEILEQVFALAESAHYAMRLAGATSSHTDSDVGILVAALGNRLDALSLRCRVVRLMLDIDRKRALELFQSMPPLRFPRLSCSDAMVYRPEEFYSTLKILVDRAFDAGEKRDGKHLEFAESFVHGMISPAQLEPAARMMFDLHLDKKELAPMLLAYGIAQRQVSADDRSFSSSTNYSLMQTLIELARLSEQKGVSSFSMVDAFRAYFVRHMRGDRCEDNADPRGTGSVLHRIAESFNSNLLPVADPEGKQIQPIKADDMEAGKVEGRAAVYHFWAKPRTQKLLEDLKHLRFGTPEQQEENNKKAPRPDGVSQFLTVEQRSELSWQREAREYLNNVENWKKDHDETEENYFHQVCFIYTPLLELVPPGQLWDSVLQSYVAFLSQSVVQKASPPEWYLHVSRLMKLQGADATTREKVLETMKTRGDIVMAIYVGLEHVAPLNAAR